VQGKLDGYSIPRHYTLSGVRYASQRHISHEILTRAHMQQMRLNHKWQESYNLTWCRVIWPVQESFQACDYQAITHLGSNNRTLDGWLHIYRLSVCLLIVFVAMTPSYFSSVFYRYFASLICLLWMSMTSIVIAIFWMVLHFYLCPIASAVLFLGTLVILTLHCLFTHWWVHYCRYHEILVIEEY
jgi:hypothetical protein